MDVKPFLIIPIEVTHITDKSMIHTKVRLFCVSDKSNIRFIYTIFFSYICLLFIFLAQTILFIAEPFSANMNAGTQLLPTNKLVKSCTSNTALHVMTSGYTQCYSTSKYVFRKKVLIQSIQLQQKGILLLIHYL